MVFLCCLWILVFFFKQKTACEMRIRDWSSDVCSSDLVRKEQSGEACRQTHFHRAGSGGTTDHYPRFDHAAQFFRCKPILQTCEHLKLRTRHRALGEKRQHSSCTGGSDTGTAKVRIRREHMNNLFAQPGWV